MGSTAPAALKPSAGLWPPVPCRYVKVRATIRPERRSGGIVHHDGTGLSPRSLGRVANTQVWDFWTKTKKK